MQPQRGKVPVRLVNPSMQVATLEPKTTIGKVTSTTGVQARHYLAKIIVSQFSIRLIVVYVRFNFEVFLPISYICSCFALKFKVTIQLKCITVESKPGFHVMAEGQ